MYEKVLDKRKFRLAFSAARNLRDHSLEDASRELDYSKSMLTKIISGNVKSERAEKAIKRYIRETDFEGAINEVLD